MSPVVPLESRAGWRFHFGKRYLRAMDFIRLCEAIGLYGCQEPELEEYERERWMFPAARMVMPTEYANAFWRWQLGSASELDCDERFLPSHRLDWALRYPVRMPGTGSGNVRHPIDEVWGRVDVLHRPRDEAHSPWHGYTVQMNLGAGPIRLSTATHFYHYWQIYELYQVRKRHKGMYGDNALLRSLDAPTSSMLEATSYFQHLQQTRRARQIEQLEPDEDGLVSLDQSQQQTLDRAAAQYAAETLQRCDLDEEALYTGLRGMMALHISYEEADRFRLAKSLEADLWRAVELIHFALDRPTEVIAGEAGTVGGCRRNYLELVFPNRREVARSKALRIMGNLVDEHNSEAPGFSMSESNLEQFMRYVEATNLAWFQYVMAELNTALFARHSWRTSETFLHLKGLASFPESFMKVIILNGADASARNTLLNQRNPGLGFVVCQVFGGSFSPLLNQYQTIGQNHWTADTPSDFAANSQHLISRITSAQTHESYLGANLALATLLRNFTSHYVVEDPQLLRGHYVRCVRAILSSGFAAWKAAQCIIRA
ncbi:MAG: hypothetical protein U9R72_04320, partial [Chloroflexota bacterium]|nr:hypothetical protein [Chloroflexota bacterium]